MIRRLALPAILAATAMLAGCSSARDAAALRQAGFGPDSYVEGGVGSPFYAEVVYAKDGAKPRVHLFGTLAAYDAFVAAKEVPETGHRKIIRQPHTLIVQVIAGHAAKEDPGFSERLVARYLARHPAPAPVAEVAPAPAK